MSSEQRSEIAGRLAKAQREVEAIADALMVTKTSKRCDRQHYARRLNAVCSSLKTAEMTADGPLPARLTAHEARALRLACIFGTPDPTPPEIMSALKMIRAIEERRS